MLSADDLDRRLIDVRTAIDRMGQNLFDLENAPTKAVLDVAPLRGSTATAWSGAAERLANLWKAHRGLSDVVSAAADFRSTRRRLSDGDRVELERRLFGPSVKVEGDGLDPAQRSLTGANTSATVWTIDDLLATMAPVYSSLTEAIAKSGRVWDDATPRLDKAGEELRRLRSSADANGARWPNSAAAIERLLAATREAVVTDPIGADLSALTRLEAGVDQLRSEIGQSLAASRELNATLGAIEATLAQAAADLDAGAVKREEAAQKIAGSNRTAEVASVAAAEIATLRQEAARASGLAAGELEAAGRLATQLKTRADAVAERARAIRRASGQGLDTRTELRGRLDAYRAKAQATGRAEDRQIETLYQKARDALYTAPCDLVGAEALLREYQKAVSNP